MRNRAYSLSVLCSRENGGFRESGGFREHEACELFL